MEFNIFFIPFLFILKSKLCSSLEVNGYCGDPGIPHRSQLTPMQTIYSEDETITYKCDDFISLKQYRKCVKGKWRGDHAICANAFRDNDVKWAKIFNRSNGSLIHEYNTSVLLPFPKFGNSYIAERSPEQPLRSFGADSYRIELWLDYKSIFHWVRISLSLVNHLIDPTIRRSNFNITKVTISPFRTCRLYSQSEVSPWLHNSTRYDYWYFCDSNDEKSFDKEIKDKSDLVVIETESTDELELDLATFILGQPYINNGNIKEPICGTPEIPVGLSTHVINHNTRYAYKCAQGFRSVDPSSNSDIATNTFDLFCSTDMKWKGKLPECLPEKTCKKFELTEKHLVLVFLYEKVYYYNESNWFAIEGTKAYFRCKDETQIFVGKEMRFCGKDGQWSDSLPNCIDTDKESTVNLTNISIIIMLTLFVTFGLTAILVYFGIRMKRTRSGKLNANERRESNIYDDYDFTGVEGKNIEENYEYVGPVDPDRYADNRQMQKPVNSMYTPMAANYKYNYNDKNVYDDCEEYQSQHNPITISLDESYIVMKKV